MKLLLVSIPSIHLRRWASQLEGSGHQVHWFDVADGDPVPGMDWLTHHYGWRYKGGNFKGRSFLKKHLPALAAHLENDMATAFARVMDQVRPDAVHSFVMYKSAVPIFKVMHRYPDTKWIYSSWGSDLYLFRNFPRHRADLQRVLPVMDYLFTDTQRDVQIAQELGFKGTVLGVFPGGGGFNLEGYQHHITPYPDRNTLLIKGYQGRSGRAVQVLQALEQIPRVWEQIQVQVFGADREVEDYIHASDILAPKVVVLSTKKQMAPHQQVLKWMGQAAIYIGNSDSDGMPNTLLEAMIMGAFPIQSNPGGATAEVVIHQKNGLLIQDPMDQQAIGQLIRQAIKDEPMRIQAFGYNMQLKAQWGYDLIRKQVLSCYQTVANSIT